MMQTDPKLATPATRGGDTGLIASDLTCVNCGYNLRGLRENGVCPECAHHIGSSIRGNRLIHADRTWLRRLRFGVTMLLVLVFVDIAYSMVSFAPSVSPLYALLGIAWNSFLIVLHIIAVFCITATESWRDERAESLTVRKLIRTSAIVALVIYIPFVVFLPVISNIVLAFGIALLGLSVTVFALFGCLVYLRRLALRMPDAALAGFTRIVIRGLAILLALLLAESIMKAGGIGLDDTGEIIVGLFCLIILMLFIVLLFRYRRMFNDAIIYAECVLEAKTRRYREERLREEMAGAAMEHE